MSNVVNLDGSMTVDEIIDEAKDMKFEDIIVLGTTSDERLFMISSLKDKADINFFIDLAKSGNLHG